MTANREDLLLEPLDDSSGPAKRISSQRAADLVRAVVDRSVESAAPVPRSQSPRRWRRVVLVAAALLVVAGGASAAIYELTVDEPQPAVKPQSSESASRSVRETAAPPAEAVVVEPIEEPGAGPVLPAKEKQKRAKPSREIARRDPLESPDDLLARANERRKARDWREAAALYERVRAEHEGTTAAYVATVAAASIHLEHLNGARRALTLYRAAMRARPNGYLAEEARHGIAEAHRARGARQAEADALAEFLAEHPESPLRERAEDRLRQIRPAPGPGDDQGSGSR